MMPLKRHLVSHEVVQELIDFLEAEIDRLGLRDEWRKRVSDPEMILESNYDWPLQMAKWLLEKRQ